MIEANQQNSREMENALKALEQAKARVANERKKLNEKRRNLILTIQEVMLRTTRLKAFLPLPH